MEHRRMLRRLPSMRPPHEAGEVIHRADVRLSACASFNEAPARGGGGRGQDGDLHAVSCTFNEAPARGGGGQELRVHIIPSPFHLQ